MIRDRPLLGHGAGTFEAVEPLYHSPGVDSAFVWRDAHSTWLEAFASLGVPVTVVLLAMIAYVIARLFRAWRRSVKDVTAIVAALSAATALGLHAFLDFSLENQAVAIYFVSLQGLAIGQQMRLRELS
jgi:O-antigen ligase